jgi:hypothetical protein
MKFPTAVVREALSYASTMVDVSSKVDDGSVKLPNAYNEFPAAMLSCMSVM